MEMKLNLSVADIMSIIKCLEFLKGILCASSFPDDAMIDLIAELISKLKSISF